MYTLNATDNHGVVWPETALALKARHDGSPEPDVGGGQNIVCYALDQQGGKGGSNTSGPKVLAVDCRNGTEDEVNNALQASACRSLNSNNVVRVTPAVYDARGNGDGGVAPTMTGDHQNRITDYTAIVVKYEETIQQSEE